MNQRRFRTRISIKAYCLPSCAEEPKPPSPSARWEKSIAAFEAADAKSPPTKGGIVFVGSSSIRMWKLEESFPGLNVLNRGFGGSEVADSLHFADRIIFPYEPTHVVVYAGDNDIAKGKTPQRVASDFKKLTDAIHERLPKTHVLFIAIKPSTKRWSMYEKMADANQRIRDQAELDDLLTFIDIATPMLGEDGTPKAELFLGDGLHLTPKGYALWTPLVKAGLK